MVLKFSIGWYWLTEYSVHLYCQMLQCCYTSVHLFEHLPVALSLIFLIDHLPCTETVFVGEPHSRVLKHLIQSVHSWVQWCNKSLCSTNSSVGSFWMAQNWTSFRSLGSLLFWAKEVPMRSGTPAEEVGRQEGDWGVDPHHEVEKKHQYGVQVLFQLHFVLCVSHRDVRVWQKML